MKKARIAVLLVIAMLLSLPVCACAEGDNMAALSEADLQALDRLGTELEEPAAMLMHYGEDVEDIYSELRWKSIADTFPEKFDLPIKLTMYPTEEVMRVHQLDNTIKALSGYAAFCPECGFTLLDCR